MIENTKRMSKKLCKKDKLKIECGDYKCKKCGLHSSKEKKLCKPRKLK